MRYIFTFLLFTSIVLSSSINESMLKIHATLVPKMLFMDYNFEEKISDNTISILISYDKSDYISAKQLQREIQYRYPNGLKSYKISIVLVPYSKLDIYTKEMNIYYIFPSSDKNIDKVLKIAKRSNAFTFSYLNDNLENGVMCSLLIGSKVKPILNLDAIKSSNIIFRPVLLKISEIYKSKK